MAFATIDEYVKTFPPATQKVLEEVRKTIQTAAPGAVETISYQIPTFQLEGRKIIHFAAYANHIGFYPTPSGPDDFDEEIAPYRSGKSTIRFPLKDPIPHHLVRKIVELQIKATSKTRS